MKKKKSKKDYWHPQKFVINVDMFSVDVGFAINNTEKEIKTWLKRIAGEKYEKNKDYLDEELKGWDDLTRWNGRMIPLSGGFIILVRMEKDYFRKSLGCLVHEINHCVNWLLMDRRIQLTKDNDEVYAYLSEFLTRAALLKMY